MEKTALFVLAGFLAGNFLYADIITFDDVPGADPLSAFNDIPDGYGDLNWENLNVLHESYNPGSGFENGVVSGEWAAFNSYEEVAGINGELFTFDGAYLTGAWNDGLNINVVGYRDGMEIYNTAVVVNTEGPTWFDFNYANVDELVFSSYGGISNPNTLYGYGTHFVMDDFTFHVPEPATLTFIGMGLLFLVGLIARKRSWSFNRGV